MAQPSPPKMNDIEKWKFETKTARLPKSAADPPPLAKNKQNKTN